MQITRQSAFRSSCSGTANVNLTLMGKGNAMKAWFVPPIVIPLTIILVVAVYAIIQALH
jgi:hypothetical protein